MSQQTNVADLLKNIDMDALVRIMKPSATPDGARQLILPVYNTQVSLKAFPGSKHLTDAQLDEALIAARDLAIEFEMKLSRTRADSEVTRLNDAHGEWVELSERPTTSSRSRAPTARHRVASSTSPWVPSRPCGTSTMPLCRAARRSTMLSSMWTGR